MMESERIPPDRRSPSAPVISSLFSSGASAPMQLPQASDSRIVFPYDQEMFAMVNDVLQNSHLDRFGPITLTYLRIDADTFQAIAQLRRDSEDTRELHLYHPSIFTSPPRDLWDAIVRIRGHAQWQRCRSLVIQRVRQVLVNQLSSQDDSHSMSFVYSGSGRNNPTLERKQKEAYPRETSNSVATSTSDDEGDINIQGHSPGRVVSANKKISSRTPPSGHCYKCPSKGCKRTYWQKRGHLMKHIHTMHPDYLALNPNYEPNHYLAPTPDVRSNSREKSSEITKRGEKSVDSGSRLRPPQMTSEKWGETQVATPSASSSASYASFPYAKEGPSTNTSKFPEFTMSAQSADFVPGYDAETNAQDQLSSPTFDSGSVQLSDPFNQNFFFLGNDQTQQSMDVDHLSYDQSTSMDSRSYGDQHRRSTDH